MTATACTCVTGPVEAAHKGQLEDYAVYTLALLELYRASFDAAYLEEAVFRADQMVDLFEDRDRGGYFITPRDGERLIARPKETYDGAIPSGNSAAAMALQALADLTGEVRWREAALQAASLPGRSGGRASHPEQLRPVGGGKGPFAPQGAGLRIAGGPSPGTGGLSPDEGRRGSVRSGQDGGERGPAGPGAPPLRRLIRYRNRGRCTTSAKTAPARLPPGTLTGFLWRTAPVGMGEGRCDSCLGCNR